MKSSRFQEEYRKSASRLHKKTGDVLKELFPNHKIYQEYPVVRVNTTYQDTSHHFDWVILDLMLVIECHGVQHFIPTSFGKQEASETLFSFQALQRRDRSKMDAAIAAGFTYIEIPYTDYEKVSGEYIMDLYESNRVDTPVEKKVDEKKESAREYRRQQYQRMKEWKKNVSTK